VSILRKARVKEFSTRPTKTAIARMIKEPPGECRYTPSAGVMSVMNARVENRKNQDFESISINSLSRKRDL
jgi:hypothetical protein